MFFKLNNCLKYWNYIKIPFSRVAWWIAIILVSFLPTFLSIYINMIGNNINESILDYFIRTGSLLEAALLLSLISYMNSVRYLKVKIGFLTSALIAVMFTSAVTYVIIVLLPDVYWFEGFAIAIIRNVSVFLFILAILCDVLIENSMLKLKLEIKQDVER